MVKKEVPSISQASQIKSSDAKLNIDQQDELRKYHQIFLDLIGLDDLKGTEALVKVLNKRLHPGFDSFYHRLINYSGCLRQEDNSHLTLIRSLMDRFTNKSIDNTRLMLWLRVLTADYDIVGFPIDEMNPTIRYLNYLIEEKNILADQFEIVKETLDFLTSEVSFRDLLELVKSLCDLYDKGDDEELVKEPLYCYLARILVRRGVIPISVRK